MYQNTILVGVTKMDFKVLSFSQNKAVSFIKLNSQIYSLQGPHSGLLKMITLYLEVYNSN